jgi:hypothetical protein
MTGESLKVMMVLEQYLMLGQAQMMITPPLNTEMSGFSARSGRSTGVHDPLWAKTVVISDYQTKIALVIADLIGVDAALVKAVRAQIGQLTDILPENVIVGAIHTHSGPAVLTQGYLGKVDPAYYAALIANLAQAVVLADQDREPVELWVGAGNCPEVGKNRRHPAGPTDPQVLTASFQSAAGTKALIVNYACHPVVLGPDNLKISADYPFYLRQALESDYPDAQIIFINGACGDINTGHSAQSSVDGTADPSKRTFAEAQRLGEILADKVRIAVANAVKQTDLRLKFNRTFLQLALEPIPTVGQYEAFSANWERQARELEERRAGYGAINGARVRAEWAAEMKELRLTGKLEPALSVEIDAFAIGVTEWVAFPGEFLHQLGLILKKARFPRQVFVLGYSNGTLGYVADAPAYSEGGYEVDESFPFYGLPAKLARGSGERVIEALQNMLADLAK